MSSITFVLVLTKWSRFKLIKIGIGCSLRNQTARSHSYSDVKSVTVADSVIPLAANVKILGATLDEHLSMDKHVDRSTTTCDHYDISVNC